MKSIPENVLRTSLRLVYANPEKNLPKLVNWAQPIAAATGRIQEKQWKMIKRITQDPSSGGYGLIMRIIHQTDYEVLEKYSHEFCLQCCLVWI